MNLHVTFPCSFLSMVECVIIMHIEIEARKKIAQFSTTKWKWVAFGRILMTQQTRAQCACHGHCIGELLGFAIFNMSPTKLLRNPQIDLIIFSCQEYQDFLCSVIYSFATSRFPLKEKRGEEEEKLWAWKKCWKIVANQKLRLDRGCWVWDWLCNI